MPLLAALLVSAGGQPKAKTNVVLLLSDDFGYGEPGYNGGPASTPNLDAMAAAPTAMLLSRFYCGGAVCSPTRASLLTGRTPNRVCMWDWISLDTHMHLPHTEFTIAHAAAMAGAESFHAGKWHLGHFAHRPADPREGPRGVTFNATTPAHVGFSRYYSTMPQAEISTTFNCGCIEGDPNGTQCVWGHWRYASRGAGRKPYCDRMYFNNGSSAEDVGFDPRPMVRGGYGADNAALIVDKAESFIRSRVAAGGTFLAAIWFQNVHVEYTATAEFTGLYPIDPGNTSHAGVPDQTHQDYYGCVSAMDAQVGRVRRLLVELGVATDTLVVFTADNGPEVGTPGHTYGLAGRKRSLTEGGIRMPSILEWPARITRNHNVSWPAVSNDLLPTLLDIWRVESSTGWVLDGVSLLPLIDAAEAGGPLPRRTKGIGHATMLPGDAWDSLNGRIGPPSFDSSYIVREPGVHGQAPPDQCADAECSHPETGDSPIQQQLAWTDHDYKLWVHLENVTAQPGPKDWWVCNSVRHGTGSRNGCVYVYRLYNIANDPYERVELAATMPARVNQMTHDLMSWYSSVLDSSAAKGPGGENRCRAKGWRPP